MIDEQERKCASCGTERPTHKHRFAVDHDHVTGKIRGILCGNCNSALGLLKDNINNVQGLLKYIQKEGAE